ncbi:MAG: hypothetical protein DWQ05_18800 [Calditrichaeota bacterium]|nr:MAG: hypothetical protein DWQ05_18800 [Calditrichota bacterium]
MLFHGDFASFIVRPKKYQVLLCPECSTKLPENGRYCPQCSYDLAQVVCFSCQAEIEKEWQCCPYCRANLTQEKNKETA